MDTIIDWKQINKKSIYEQLKEHLIEQRIMGELEIHNEHLSLGEETEQLEYLEEDHEFYSEKLELTNEICKISIKDQQRYIKNMINIDCLNDISNGQKIKMMITYGTLLCYFKKIHERSDNELFMLSAFASGIDLDEYQFYMKILIDKKLSEKIVNKAEKLSEQVDIAYEIKDSLDETPYNFVTSENYQELINNAYTVVDNYAFENTKQ